MRTSAHSISSIISLLLLSLAVAYWPELFFFSKSVHLPAWAEHLPTPINAPIYVALACLTPSVVTSASTKQAATSGFKVVLLAPLLGLLLYVLQPQGSFLELLANTVFHYLWIIGFNCLLPLAALLCVRGAWQLITRRQGRTT